MNVTNTTAASADTSYFGDMTQMSLGEKMRAMGESLWRDDNEKRRLEMGKVYDAKMMAGVQTRFDRTQDRIENKSRGLEGTSRALPESVSQSFAPKSGREFLAMAIRA